MRKLSEREAAMDILTRVDREQAYSNLLLNQTLQKNSYDRQEAALMTELVYGTIQRLNTLDYFLNRFVKKGVNKLDAWVRSLLRLSLYQLLYLDKVPEFAIVNEAVKIARRRGHQGISGMVNGVLRNAIRQKTELIIPTHLPKDEMLSLETSHPLWLVQRWIRQYGVQTATRMCEANNKPPHVSIRANRMLTTREQLLHEFAAQGITARPSLVSDDGIIVGGAGNMAFHEGFKQGIFSIQDESSMLVAAAVGPEPGMKVLDCCAAPGGKTAHMAEKMDDQGDIWANDIHEHKKKLIDDQARRLKLNCIRTIVSDALHLKDRFKPESFDRILLDAPCSGLGVIRRKPDLKWQKSEEDIHSIKEVQASILEVVSDLLKPGGTLIYSTCTTEFEENEWQIQSFLSRHTEYEWDHTMAERMPKAVLDVQDESAPGMVQLLPHYFHSDGFFIACLRKNLKIGCEAF